jgi:hypothetical protein
LLSLLSALALAAVAFTARPSRPGIRCIVLENDDTRSATWTAVAALGANVVARAAPPGPEADRAAGEAGVSYISLLTTTEIEGLRDDAARLQELRSENNLAGFFYLDVDVPEGFTSPDSQRRAYETLKALFPAKIVLYPARLDPIVWSPGFLDGFFRPEFTDIVTPYYYPVGTTPIGQAREQEDWQSRLAQLLAELAPRVPAGKPILPVLQGYEQQGYPVGTRFPAAQLDVYRRFWPELNDAAIEGWEYGPGPLTALVSRPALQEGVCVLFARLAGPARRCGLRPIASWR